MNPAIESNKEWRVVVERAVNGWLVQTSKGLFVSNTLEDVQVIVKLAFTNPQALEKRGNT